jgi:hypothetical protein
MNFKINLTSQSNNNTPNSFSPNLEYALQMFTTMAPINLSFDAPLEVANKSPPVVTILNENNCFFPLFLKVKITSKSDK